MPKEEIVEGLRFAMSKGDSLEKAMNSFFNAGYSAEDIEEAARYIQSPQVPGQQNQQPPQGYYQPQPPKQVQTPSVPTQPQTIPAPIPIQPNYQQIPVQNNAGVVQRVSSYGRPPSSTGTAITILLFILLLFLFGVLAAVIIFKDELTTFFNNFIWRTLF